jgi:hypothetical protein
MANYPPQRDQYGRYNAPSGPRFTIQANRISGNPRSLAGAVVAWVCAFVTIAVMAIVWGPIHDLIYNYLPEVGLVTGTSVSAGVILTAFDVFMVMMAIGTILAALVNSVT